ncbi:transcriptional regulator family: Fungal Specific TF [Aspergillus niger]|uniref:Zn(2)-C6 fungal-type domain-containing protein n=1 Tax=Aspergillus phoenicis ATCC 13157 TaxID=1353007 RepID=A0A370PDP2_ASPPH|nr:transcriptional regulator family: Fungal Specific TF [Aspergillus niger]RDK40307.1 hypothetical protein M752DRAFT_41357 [Aspergillus phoenicis ATCC 13157]KAI2919390.1 transcriptional regulator family: Fungal Specific TF [Aspergillus niger]KAI2927559.1 transcriptional regulator family: Fungal Specific TF [Aspergillus niger]KAI2979159.1 transcriptional regulator family: Fungal Specific TF [Aspergillus niger]
MAPDIPRPPTLRRSCQACARGKRRCDQRWPRCTRCQTRKIDCEYINVPLTVGSDTGSTATTTTITTRSTLSPKLPHKKPRQHYQLTTTHSIPLSLPLEITKGYSQPIIAYLVSGMRAYPSTFALNMKTHFIHPDLWPSPSSPPLPIRDIHALCKLHSTSTNKTIIPLLKQKSSSLLRTLNHTTSFEEMLATAQALLLTQCMLVLSDTDTSQSYSESISTMLYNLGQKLWQQAPIQLPGSLSPRRAWLFAESVRRTIIVGFMLRSVYSLKMRNYSVRTPFVDSLPFDMRTGLWDRDVDVGGDASGESLDAMVSLHQYSGMLESGMVHGISEFGGLILAACRGRAVQGVPYPSVTGYAGY